MSPVAGAWVPSLDKFITTSRITMSTATFYNRTFKNILNLVGTRTISRGNKKANATRLQFRNFPNMETDTVIVAITAYVWIPSILLYISTTQSGGRSLTIKWRCRGAVVARCQTTRGQPRDAWDTSRRNLIAACILNTTFFHVNHSFI